jgi:hypothetical protein
MCHLFAAPVVTVCNVSSVVPALDIGDGIRNYRKDLSGTAGLRNEDRFSQGHRRLWTPFGRHKRIA